MFLDFPCSSAGKESACNVGDLGSTPGLGRSPGERLPTPVIWPGEFHGLYSPRGHKEPDMIERLSLSQRCVTFCCIATWASYIYVYTHVHISSLPPSTRPSRPSQSAELGSPCSRAASRWLTVAPGAAYVSSARPPLHLLRPHSPSPVFSSLIPAGFCVSSPAYWLLLFCSCLCSLSLF